jgi:branched-chain amino acid transport system substrate-binding protein
MSVGRAQIFFALFLFLSRPVLADESALVVGVIAPITGDFAPYGRGVMNGMRLADERLQGARLKLAFEDNPKCDSASAVSALQKLRIAHKVGVIVTVCTAAAQGVLPIARASRIPLIQLTESGSDPNNVMLKLMPDGVRMASLHGERYAEKYRRLAIIGSEITNNIGERGNFPLVTKAFESRGGKVVFSELVPPDTTDFRALIEKIRRSDAQAVSPFIGTANGMALFLKQADDLSLWAEKDLVGNFLFEFLLAELVKLYPHPARLEGLESINLAQMTDEKFKLAYEARYHEPPPQFADYGYDTVSILKLCGVDAGCYRVGRTGISGRLEFDDRGRRSGAFDIKRLQNGVFEKIQTVQ